MARQICPAGKVCKGRFAEPASCKGPSLQPVYKDGATLGYAPRETNALACSVC